MTTALQSRRTVISGALLVAMALVMMMGDSEPRCSLPDPKGPDGWRTVSDR